MYVREPKGADFSQAGARERGFDPDDTPSPFAKMDVPFIPDESPRKLGPSSDIQEIGLSFPMFEMTERGAREGIATGNVLVVQTADSWTLSGDGAQPTVMVERLSEPAEKELRVRVKTGALYTERGWWTSIYLRKVNGWLNLGPNGDLAAATDIPAVSKSNQ